MAFFFNDTATTEIYTLSLHDALPISAHAQDRGHHRGRRDQAAPSGAADRKSTRLNSSHANISYAVFCLKNINAAWIQCWHINPRRIVGNFGPEEEPGVIARALLSLDA